MIVWLWELVHAMDSEHQRAFLHYVTGSGRVPIKGLGTLKMVIQQNGEHSDRLPTALTCFSRTFWGLGLILDHLSAGRACHTAPVRPDPTLAHGVSACALSSERSSCRRRLSLWL